MTKIKEDMGTIKLLSADMNAKVHKDQEMLDKNTENIDKAKEQLDGGNQDLIKVTNLWVTDLCANVHQLCVY